MSASKRYCFTGGNSRQITKVHQWLMSQGLNPTQINHHNASFFLYLLPCELNLLRTDSDSPLNDPDLNIEPSPLPIGAH